MVSTTQRLIKFHGKDAKIIVWQYNTHIGDSRATDVASEGMVNVGQLVREQHLSEEVVTVGFGSYKGSVVAGREWGDSMRKIKVPEAILGSWEHAFHIAGNGKNKLLLMNKVKDAKCLSSYIGHRAIGVVYNPEHKRFGNYVIIGPKRYNALIILDKTSALHLIHIQRVEIKSPKHIPLICKHNPQKKGFDLFKSQTLLF